MGSKLPPKKRCIAIIVYIMSLGGRILLSLIGNAIFTALVMLLIVVYLVDRHIQKYVAEEYSKVYRLYTQVLEHETEELQNMREPYTKLFIGKECQVQKGYFLTLPSGTVYGIQRKLENDCYFVGEPIEELLKMVKFMGVENYAVVIYREWLDLEGQDLDEYMRGRHILDNKTVVEMVSKKDLISYPLNVNGWEIHGEFLNKTLLMELPLWFQDGSSIGKIVLFRDLTSLYERAFESAVLLMLSIVLISLMSLLLLHRIVSYLIRGLYELTQAAKQIEMGNFTVLNLLQKNNTDDEVGLIKKAFYDVIVRIGQLINELELKNKKLEELAYYDSLTGLPNRRYFFINAQTLIENAKRYNTPLSVMIMDVDNFKKVNDTFGHDAGDIVLKSFANTLKSGFRSSDIFARLGGEEFAALLPNTNMEGAYKVAERLRQDFENTVVIYGNNEIKTTVSIGISYLKSDLENIDNLLKEADEALYEAKSTGKNKVVIYTPKTEEHQREGSIKI